jgi:hypothetical protein
MSDRTIGVRAIRASIDKSSATLSQICFGRRYHRGSRFRLAGDRKNISG